LVKLRYHDKGIGGRHGAKVSQVDVILPSLVTLKVQRQASHIDVIVVMPQQVEQDGHCGNFNLDVSDDTEAKIKARMGEQVLQSESLFDFDSSAPIAEDDQPVERTVEDDCAEPAAAKAACEAALGADALESVVQMCMFDVCFSGADMADMYLGTVETAQEESDKAELFTKIVGEWEHTKDNFHAVPWKEGRVYKVQSVAGEWRFGDAAITPLGGNKFTAGSWTFEYDADADQLKQFVEDDEEHPSETDYIVSKRKEWKCQNKRDDKGKEKCVNYLASVGAYNPSCEKQLKQWASCDSTCNLCQCSTYNPEIGADLSGLDNHCSGHGKCMATCEKETCNDGAHCECDEGWSGDRCTNGRDGVQLRP